MDGMHTATGHVKCGDALFGRSGFHGYDSWGSAHATGAHLLWRCASNRQLPVTQALSDGSFLSVFRPSTGVRRKDARAAVTVRVIEYALPGTQGAETRYRLLTTRLNEQQAPALELAVLSHERWEVEGVFDELTTHIHQRCRALPSKTADLVRQEFYGWVLTRYAGRWLMHAAATEHQGPPRA